MKETRSINIETLILVAVWDNPAIFQGAFKISLQSDVKKPIFLFFRCEYVNKLEQDTIIDSFSSDDYAFSHLYNKTQLIHLDRLNEGVGYAEYVLKYALHKTLLEMQSSQKQKFTAIDDIAMNAIIKRVEPMLKQEKAWTSYDNDLGFAASMDFHPQETMGRLAVEILLNFDCGSNGNFKIH
ncbi:hypothetical protein [Legionella hackeliae]|uniref:Uncharacterized protein n=1 Tax=Legionella hackeliae TaxID=449 RepID=A0A0A8UNP1_LEGHA|nr:hypothetical protein [Legionella hackeliae]KTD14173.1 hypothetical protein Lhac_0485 [Legionella hackeliae]CEK10383.1 conserved protein of unknown function [Legionella hackeliae]STX47117.1 Uncharacterised protein [Legionella hackeliae]